ncbi:MAG: bifunctional riboflavin kinase/FAD synthetase [Anaerolineae bacterium]|nr:bifunctional riboflavin kinase/FAD synthetase [Anaerolineae bacterium]
MNHFQSLNEAWLDQPSILTIGVFDGVHRGHQHLIRQLVAEARQTHRIAAALTFFPHPDRVLHHLVGPHYLTTPEERARILHGMGVETVITLPFDEDARHMRAAAFVDTLRERLRMQSLWVTTDFALGYQREGDFMFLKAQGTAKGFEVRATDLLFDDQHKRISSSGIRDALLSGEVTAAADWLGRPYRVSGEVVHGDHRGRTIGFPTANIAVWEEQIMPANGVYACRAFLEGESLLGVTNIGRRPTFGETESIRVETHLLDFNRDIYGHTLALDFMARLRSEQKFPSLEALVAQIGADVLQGRAILASLKEQE